jgi:glyoxylase-like metal-dependent hydrolase (beta-lactamase superfamily II)
MILLSAGNASSWTGPTGNNTWLLRGQAPTLIDAGVGNAEHIDAIARELRGTALASVLITHSHPDHASGAPALAARWPGLRIRQFGGGSDPLVDNERIAAGDSRLTVMYTPGHAPDHCCFVAGKDVFCGDLVRLGGTVVIPASHGGDLAQYLESLRRVRGLNPERLLPGHGPIIEDPAAIIDQYLHHRAERETQVIDALRAGCRTPQQIVVRLYEGLPPELLPAAAESVIAHLIKLANEGKAVQESQEWRLTT